MDARDQAEYHALLDLLDDIVVVVNQVPVFRAEQMNRSVWYEDEVGSTDA